MPSVGFAQGLFQFGLYKRNQGKITRQITFAAVAITLGIGAWQMFASEVTKTWLNVFSGIPESSGMFVFPLLLLVFGVWFAYRLVNLANFADFLIAVEAEMNKVSWPSRGELIRASLVVICVIILLATSLWIFDIVWRALFIFLQVVPKG